MDADSAETPLKLVVEDADVGLASIDFDGVVVGEADEVPVDVRIAVEPAIHVEVAGALHTIIPAMPVTADEIVVA